MLAIDLGPTLLFEQATAKDVKRFFACSACRDKKLCSFYQLENEKISKEKQQLRKSVNEAAQPKWKHCDFQSRAKKFTALSVPERRFCQTCSLLLLKKEWGNHSGHTVQQNVTDEMLQKPSELLTSLGNNKTNAQYLFTQRTVELVIYTLERFQVTHVLCIGSPRIHENLMRSHPEKFKSLLLDIDHRFGQFFDEEHYCRYNMFNHHFFEENRNSYTDFLLDAQHGKLLIVMDPPFGGLVEVLAHTIQCINEDCLQAGDRGSDVDSSPDLMLFFPYFNEPQIQTHMPQLKMVDYKVSYANHRYFKIGSKMKPGSPIRIFTDLNLSEFVLPPVEGYRYCEECQRYVHSENLHCEKCRTCTSKDGRIYVHCDKCKRCVKPARMHCDQCKQCVQKDHICGEVKPGSCFLCGGFGHKKRECPYANQLKNQSRIRKRASVSSSTPNDTNKKRKKKRSK